MTSVPVELGDNSYQINIIANLLSSDETSQLIPKSHQYAIISNQQIADLYLSSVKKLLPDEAAVTVLLIPDTEQSKSLTEFSRLHDALLEAKFNRSSTIIALGGGVVGDLSGFVAATLHRGCNFVQIPTSLLAQVDSSVGGKTAINHSSGKNLIGSFYQPKVVLIDPQTLKTLDSRQFSAGMAEVIKYAFIEDSDFLLWLEENKKAISDFELPVLEQMIAHCCRIKAAVVSADEKEKGQRVLLNFGHTFGHALENISGYGVLLHGEAVSIGMLLAAKLSVTHNLMESQFLQRLEQLLVHFNLPTTIPNNLDAKELLASMYRDKKNLSNNLQLILPHGPGHTESQNWDADETIINLLVEFGADK